MIFRFAVWAALILAIGTPPVFAQNVDDYVRIGPRPNWVATVDLPDYDPSEDEGRETVFPLVEYQNRHSLDTDEYSTRYIVDLLTSAAVEEQGTLTIDFDPDYERLMLHRVSLTRDGRQIDAMDMSEAMVFRTETDRDQMIFNGTLTFSLPILDLRVGDRLEVAYTQSGRNPAIKQGFLSRRSFGTQSVVKRRFLRSYFGPGVDLQTKQINDPPEPEIIEDGGWTIYQWDRPDPRAPDYDSDAPPWVYLRPTYEFSNFESWSDVGNLFANYYSVTDANRAAVRDIVDQIAEEHNDPKARTRAALDWVQMNIRYVGLELGEGGFIPRPPARVLRRRFGDCKDVTLLLLTLLDELGVEADPILVDLDERGGEFKGLPHPYAFNHIKVVAEIDGSLYPLDATRDRQTGTLDTMEKGDIEFGLRLIDGASVVTRLPQSDYEFREVVTERFDLVSEPGTILYSLIFEEYGEDADGTLSWIAGQGEADVLDGFVSYLTDIYPTLETDGPLEWSSDPEAAKTELRFNFRLPGYTQDDRPSLRTRAYQVLAAIPSFEGGTRDAPFEIKHPRSVRQIREYIGDEDYTFEARARTIETDAFLFSYKDTVEDHTLREDYRWTSKRDYIAAENFEEDMESIKKIIDWNYTTINLSFDADAASETEPLSPIYTGLGWLFLIGFPAIVFFAIFRSRKAELSA